MTPEQIKSLWPLSGITPREVQLEALAAGYGKTGFAYFMRQRLGKTFTAIAEYMMLRKEGKVDWLFIICPNSIKQQWKEQIELVNPFIPIQVYESQSKKNTINYFTRNKRGGVFIINYEGMKAFIGIFTEELFFSPERTYLVADESTKIKEPTAKMTKAAHALSELCAYKRVLTGKPSAGNNAHLWGQLKFISSTELNYYQFRHRFVMLGGYQGRMFLRNVNEEALKSQIAPFCYIAPDKYIKGFEKVYEPMRRVNLTGDLERMYKAMEDDLVLAISSDTKITAPIVLTKYLRLQQISSGVAGDMDGTQHNLVDPFDNPRIKIVKEILDNEIDHKVIIACRFRLSIENLEKVLTHEGHKIVKLVGGMRAEDIERAKREFNQGDTNIMLAQLQVLSLGHTLPGPRDNRCDSMIYYENDFSLLNRMQSESRPEDADDQIPISYYDMYSSKMDRYILESLIRKEDASLKLMGYAREHGLRPELSKAPKPIEELPL